MLLANLLRPFHFRGKGRILNALCERSGVKSATVFGYRADFDLSDHIQRKVYLGIFEPKESAWVRRYLKPGMTFVDAGANIGYYSLLAASLVGERGRVYAFEPSPYVYERLTRIVSENHVAQITALPLALSDEPGRAELYSQIGTHNHSPSLVVHATGTSVEVGVTTLKSVMQDAGIGQIDLIKMDIQGFEPNLIKGAGRAIEKVRAILTEIDAYWLRENGSSPQALYDLLIGLGFTPHTQFDASAKCQNLFFTRKT